MKTKEEEDYLEEYLEKAIQEKNTIGTIYESFKMLEKYK